MSSPSVDSVFANLVLLTDKERGKLQDAIRDYDAREGGEYLLSVETPTSILRAIRRLLRTKEAESVLERIVAVMRRYDEMRIVLGKAYGESLDQPSKEQIGYIIGELQERIITVGLPLLGSSSLADTGSSDTSASSGPGPLPASPASIPQTG